MSDSSSSLLGDGGESTPDLRRERAAGPTQAQMGVGESYKTGDVIAGNYEILSELGKGGFGAVFLVYSRSTREVCAMKTFRDELLADPAARHAFKKEALLWVGLELHPFILTALLVVETSGRLFVAMEHIAADAQGCVNLSDHLARAAGPLDTNETLKWAIQFCLAMEHANAHGIECHGDIKPDNILVTQNGALKISDFGLAAAAEVGWRLGGSRDCSLIMGHEEAGFGLSLTRAHGRVRCGTPGYMPPEVYRCEGADRRSDIYSFGLVLWQMALGSRMPPFCVPWRGDMEAYLWEIYAQQMAGRVPPVEGPLRPVIERCLRHRPSERYGGFQELREALEPIWKGKTGKKLENPQMEEQAASFWHNKGCSLHALGRYNEAIECYDKALAITPGNASTWNGKGNALKALARHEEAIDYYDRALAINPRYARAWNNKGVALHALGRYEEMIGCYDRVLAIDPRNDGAWLGKANGLYALGRCGEAIGCYDNALAINPRYANTWNNKGAALAVLHRSEEAIACFEKSLEIDPLYVRALIGKALQQDDLGLRREAAESYREFINLARAGDAQHIAFARVRVKELELSGL